jgi:hypothetical protein
LNGKKATLDFCWCATFPTPTETVAALLKICKIMITERQAFVTLLNGMAVDQFKSKDEVGRRKDERQAIKAELFILNSHSFILHPSYFLLALAAARSYRLQLSHESNSAPFGHENTRKAKLIPALS